MLFVLFAPLNDNHIVGRAGPGTITGNAPRLGVDVWLQQWLAGPGADGKRPLVLVAVAGGCSRAAYWGNAALARLQELGEQENVNFADSVFAHQWHLWRCLGPSTFVAALDARATPPTPRPARPGSSPAPSPAGTTWPHPWA